MKDGDSDKLGKGPGGASVDELTPTEVAIVDTFTRLIFGYTSGFDSHEKDIIQILRNVELNVALDGYEAMGEYLGALGVEEMVELVEKVRRQALINVDGRALAREPSPGVA